MIRSFFFLAACAMCGTLSAQSYALLIKGNTQDQMSLRQLDDGSSPRDTFLIKNPNGLDIAGITINKAGSGDKIQIAGLGKKKESGVSIANKKLTLGAATVDLTEATGLRALVSIQGTPGEIEVKLDPTRAGGGTDGTGIAIDPRWYSSVGSPPFVPATNDLESWLVEERKNSEAFLSSGTRVDISMGEPRIQFFTCKRNNGSPQEAFDMDAVHPHVDGLMQVRLLNYDPSRDDVEIDLNSHSFFLEHRSTFEDILGGFAGVSSKPAKGGADGTSESTGGKTLLEQNTADVRGLIQFYGELETLKSWLRSKELPAPFVARVYDQIALNASVNLQLNIRIPTVIADRAKALKTSIREEDHTAFEKAVQGIVEDLAAIKKMGTFTYLPIPIPNEDVTELQVKYLKDKVPMQVGPQASYTFRNKGGLKIDFSLGIVGSNLIDHTFGLSTEARPDTQLYRLPNGVTTDSIANIRTVRDRKIVRTNEKDIRVSGAVLMHAYFRTGRKWQLAFNSGFLLNSNEPVGYLFGGSFMFLRDQRVCLSIGALLGSVTRLDPRYQEGAVFVTQGPDDTSEPTVPTITKREWGFYGALSFNLFQTTPK